MINKNFKAICQSVFKNATSSYSLYKTDGTTASSQFSSNFNNAIAVAEKNYRKIFFGNGNTAPTVNDIALENEINDLTIMSSYSLPNKSEGTISTENGYIEEMGATVKNNTSENIVISEIGWGMSISSGSTSIIGDYLLGREVISPVTIAPGETYTFTITIGG